MYRERYLRGGHLTRGPPCLRAAAHPFVSPAWHDFVATTETELEFWLAEYNVWVCPS